MQPLLHRCGITHDDTTLAGKGIRVAVLDGGVSPLPAFGERLTRIHYDGAPDETAGTEHATRCASLIGSAHPGAMGLAPHADLVSVNVSTGHAVDPKKVQYALKWLRMHPVDIISASFVLDGTSRTLLQLTEALIHRGTAIVGAAANTTTRQAYPWIRSVRGSLRVFDATIPQAARTNSDAILVAISGSELPVVGCTGDVVPNWHGRSSGSTALIAGLLARWLSNGASVAQAISRAAARFGNMPNS
ncbi:MAG: S8/S53 family peptidase [Myxococcota bacterium]|nr:S8/S53 family peptidase [Myxococcota bacterium]